MVKVRRIRFEKKDLGLLSPLERDVLQTLWKYNDIKVRDIYNILRKRREIALTSIAVILDRLHKKDIVNRKVEPGKGGYHYIYSTKNSKADFERSILENTVDKLLDSFGSVAVTYFNERFSRKKKAS